MIITIPTLADLPDAAKMILTAIAERRIVVFEGEMGIGKTTMIKELCKQLGVKENTSSPTFSIVNEYQSSQGPVYHFDFYRLESAHEALDLGYEEYFFSGHYCFVEWPSRIEALIPDDAVHITLTLTDDYQRILHLK